MRSLGSKLLYLPGDFITAMHTFYEFISLFSCLIYYFVTIYVCSGFDSWNQLLIIIKHLVFFSTTI